MIGPSFFSSSGNQELLRYAIDLAAKATLLLLAVFACDRLCGRRGVLVRSSLWYACLIALAVLPLAGLFLPRLAIGVPSPHWMLATASSGEAASPAAPLDVAVRLDLPRQVGGFEHTGALSSLTDSIAASETAHRPEGLAVAVSWCLAIYFAVAALLALRLLLAVFDAARLARGVAHIDDDRWSAQLEHWRRRLGVRARVRLATSARTAVPIQIGWLRPVIVLPLGAVNASDEQTRAAILLHELAHVRRGDYGWNLMLRTVSIVYWPHPLVWLGGRRIAQVREQACDEVCIHWLGGGAVYRSRLIELAAGLSARRPAASLGIAMSSGSKLGRRLKMIDGSRGRADCVQSALARFSLAVAGVAVAVVLGMAALAQPIMAAPADQPPKGGAEANLPADTVSPVTLPSDPTTTTPVAVAEQGAAEPEAEPVRVRVARVKRGDLVIETVQPCDLAPFRVSNVYARVPGFVTRMAVGLGDRVEKGQLLTKLESPELQPEIAQGESAVAETVAERQNAAATVASAEANLAALEADVEQANADVKRAAAIHKYQEEKYQRLKKLHADRTVTDEDVDEQNQEVEAAKATLESARSKVNRAKAAIQLGNATIAAAKGAMNLAELRVGSARQTLDRLTARASFGEVVSPLDGVVIAINADEGDLVGERGKNRPICQVAQVSVMVARTMVPEREGLSVEPGAPARVMIDALPQKTFQAKVSRVGYNIDPATRTVRVDIDLDNSTGQLRPGMYGSAAIALGTHRGVLTMPSAPLHSGGVFKIVDGRAVKQAVKVGAQSLDRIELLSGVNEGDLVVVDLPDKKGKPFSLPDGVRVEIVKDEIETPK